MIIVFLEESLEIIKLNILILYRKKLRHIGTSPQARIRTPDS